MLMFLKYKIVLYGFLMFAVFITVDVYGNEKNKSSGTPADLITMAEEINLEPWLTYQNILVIEKNFPSMSDENRLWLLLRKAQAQYLLYIFDDFQITIKLAKLLIVDHTPAEITSAFNFYAGIAAQRNNQYKEAIALFTKGMVIAKEAHLSLLYVQGKLELAYTRSLTEAFETSLIDLQEAYVEAFALQDEFLIALINENYGAIYGYMAEYEKSIAYYEKALDSYQHFGYKAHIAEAIFGLATTYRYWKKYDLAIEKFELYQQAIAYSPQQDISFFAYYGLGMSLAEQGNCIEALKVIDQGMKFNGFIDYYAELYKRKAQCLLKLNRIDEAELALTEAEHIFDNEPELKGTRWQLEVIKIASEIAFAKGDLNAAYQLVNDYYQHYTEVIIKNSSQRLSKVRSSLELEQKNIEIVLLNQQAKVQALQVEKEQQRNKEQQYLIFFTLILIAIGIAVMLIQQRNNKKIVALSIIDPLSNLYNRRYTFEFLEKMIASNEHQKGQLAIILLDIDNFKAINDQYGHPFGDDVIRRVSAVGQLALRAEDVMGRIGGEEFLCVLPRIDAEQCLVIAKRLKNNIRQQCFNVCHNHLGEKLPEEVVSVTVSIGIACLSESALDSASLYLQADSALYQAKNQGKDTVVEYQDVASFSV